MTNNMNLCRACLSTKESFTYILCDNVSADDYCFCTSIEVHEKEELPKTLCNNCYELLESYSNFKKTCIQSQNTLVELQNSLKPEKKDRSDLFNGNVDSNYIVAVKVENENNDLHDDYSGLEDFSDEKEPIVKLKSKQKKSKRKVKLKDIKKKIIVRKHFKFTCDVCNKKFKYEDRFEAHKLYHQGKTATITCTFCNKTFMTWSGLQRHTESEHTQVKLDTLKCMKCGKIFKNRQTLKIHEKLHVNGDRNLYVCDICGKNFSTPFTLKGHLEIHNVNRERSYSCEHCGKKFFTNGMLMTHVARLHTGKRYICQICSYPFTDKYNLSKHLLIHQGVKNFKCDICEKTFGTHSTLVIHKRIHSGERPFSCSYCPKAFISKNRLVDHHRIHTGERPFRCNVCSQAFTQHGSLRRHMKVHSKPLIM